MSSQTFFVAMAFYQAIATDAESSTGHAVAGEALRRLSGQLGVGRSVTLLEGSEQCVPMTFHARRPVIVIPGRILRDPGALRIALAHELIHVRRRDFAWGVVERLVAAAYAFHPLVWAIRRSAAHLRECSCDAEVVASGVADPRTYAELLYDLTGRAPIHLGLATGIATRASNLRQRLETMKRFTDTPVSRQLRIRSTVAGVGLLLATALLGACAGQTQEPAQEEDFKEYAGDVITNSIYSEWQFYTGARRRAAIVRLEVQLDYLIAEMDEMELGLDVRSPNPALRRFQLLSELYSERLRMFETLKMEEVAERVLSGEG